MTKVGFEIDGIKENKMLIKNSHKELNAVHCYYLTLFFHLVSVYLPFIWTLPSNLTRWLYLVHQPITIKVRIPPIQTINVSLQCRL